MSELIINTITISLFLGLSALSSNLQKGASRGASHGLSLVSEGFLLAGVFSIIWLAPLEAMDTQLAEIIGIGITVCVSLGLLVALRGLSVWFAATQVSKSAQISKSTPVSKRTQTIQLAKRNSKVGSGDVEFKRGATETESAGLSRGFLEFVDSCLLWSQSCRTSSDEHWLAATFLELLGEEINVNKSCLALVKADSLPDSESPSILATRGLDRDIQVDLISRVVRANGDTDSTGKIYVDGKVYSCYHIALDSSGDMEGVLIIEQSSDVNKFVDIALGFFASALERQSLSLMYVDLRVAVDTRKVLLSAFDGVEINNADLDNSASELRVPKILFEIITKTLGSGSGNSLLSNFVAVEVSSAESEMAVSLARSSANSQPRIGFYPQSRRLSAGFDEHKDLHGQCMAAQVIERLPVHDTRPGWSRIADENLSSLIYGNVELSSDSWALIVIGSRTSDSNTDSERAIVSAILQELNYIVSAGSLADLLKGANGSKVSIANELDGDASPRNSSFERQSVSSINRSANVSSVTTTSSFKESSLNTSSSNFNAESLK